MSVFESSFKSLLQGVSQQSYRERLQGQVSAMENMLADPVTNVRRRPGAEFIFNLPWAGAAWDTIRAYFTDIGGKQVHVLVNTSNGQVKLLDEDFAVIATLSGGTYLTTTTPGNIRAASVDDELFLVNTGVTPTLVTPTGGVAPTKRGYFYIAAGAFSKEYSVTVASSVGTITASYTTPSGSGSGDAALATPAYIATQLQAGLESVKATAGIATISRVTAYVYLEGDTGTTNVAVNSSTGSTYLQASKAAYSLTTGALPAQLPSGADGFVVAVGDITTPQYYQYDALTTQWIESGEFGSATGITNMPVSVAYISSAWTLRTDNFEGCLAGDSESNPAPAFIENGITGIGAYQGRLVMLCGSFVRLSASNKPRRMYRSTITSILASDPIEVGSSANSSAAYEHAVPYQKDLLLFSAAYQALIPSNNTVITPSNATVVLTSSHESDMTSAPVSLGRTLMYSTPISSDFFGVMEMVPSQYTDSQYISTPSTPHLPKYLAGRCRFGVSSGVSGMAMFAPSGDTKSLIVHEYLWNGDQKTQQAWHRWTFKYDVAAAYFATDKVVLLFAQNDMLVGCLIDPRRGVLSSDALRRPFLDMYSSATITERVVTMPSWLTTFDPAAINSVKLAKMDGALAGEPVGFEVDGSNLKTVRSFSSGTVAIGFSYNSMISPSAPVVKDANEVVMNTNKMTVLRYIVSTENSMEYKVTVYDKNSIDQDALTIGTLYWSSSELDTGSPRRSNESLAVVPCRTNAASTSLILSTSKMGELNIVALEYVCKYNQKIRRR